MESKKSTATLATLLNVWKGDITTLKIESIVNAANESGFGCNIPGHCIDSAIHLAAGPELLEKCKTFKGGIPTGHVKITRGYKLPSKYILHVTGPKKSKRGELDFKMLASCYKECLELAKQNKITEVAFCCLSTGIFGFPKQESAEIAYLTIVKWIQSNPHQFNKIVFCVFTEDDDKIYKKLLGL